MVSLYILSFSIISDQATPPVLIPPVVSEQPEKPKQTKFKMHFPDQTPFVISKKSITYHGPPSCSMCVVFDKALKRVCCTFL